MSLEKSTPYSLIQLRYRITPYKYLTSPLCIALCLVVWVGRRIDVVAYTIDVGKPL